jgi:roadblock/LC7 domain-containing protein
MNSGVLTGTTPGGTSTNSTSTAIGDYQLFASNQLPATNVLTLPNGKTFLKSGVIAPVASYPTVPSTVTAYLNPLAPVGTIGSGGYWVSIAINPDTGYPTVLSDSSAAPYIEIRGLSTTSSSDCLTSGYYGAAVGGEVNWAYRYKVILYHKTYLGLGIDTTLTSGSTNNLINYIPASSILNSAGTSSQNRSAASIASMASNPAGNYIAISGPADYSYYYAAGLNNTPTFSYMPSSGNWTCCAWGSGVFVALRSGVTNAASSPTGVTWTAQTLPSASAWTAVASSGTLFVAVSSGGTAAASSADGTTWTARTLPISANWSGITYSSTLGLWCAVASDSAIAATSPDGITWTQRTLPTSAYWADVKWSPALAAFITVAKDGLAGAAYSLDGINWALKQLPSLIAFRHLMAGGTNTFYAIGSYWYNNESPYYASAMPVVAKTTDNGVTWKYYKPNISLGAGSSNMGIPDTGFRFLGGKIVCAWATNGTSSSSTLTAASTSDGITWSSATMTAAAGAVTWAADIAYLAPYYNIITNQVAASTTTKLWYSGDGTNYYEINSNLVATNPFNLVTAGNVMLMYGGNTAGGSIVIWKSSVGNSTVWSSQVYLGQTYSLSSMTYDAVRDIVFLVGNYSGTLYIWASYDKGTTWVQTPSSLGVALQQTFSTWTNANNGTYYSIGTTQNTVGLASAHPNASTISYTSGYSVVTNRTGFYGRSGQFIPIPVTQAGINYFTDGTNFLKVDTQKYINNVQSAYTNGPTYYYMRVK